MISCNKIFLIAAAFLTLTFSTGQATKHVVHFANFSYNPPDLTVAVGDTVEFVGDFSSSAHPLITITVPATAANVEHSSTGQDVYDYVVKVLGNYQYQCHNHGSFGMKGRFTAVASGVHYTNAAVTSVEQNNPNPAMKMTHVVFTLAKTSQVAVQIVDEKGSIIQRIPAQEFAEGRRVIMLDVTNLNSGAYFYELIVDGTVTTKQMIVTH